MSDTDQDSVIVDAISDDLKSISYRPALADLTDSALSAILLNQVMYYWKQMGKKSFYKFKEPCKHASYKPGDSWCEKLGFSPKEFDSALKIIGTKITKGASKKEATAYEFNARHPEESLKEYAQRFDEAVRHIVVYWTDGSRMTWYQLNNVLLAKLLNGIYLDKLESRRYLKRSTMEFIQITTEKGFTKKIPKKGLTSDSDKTADKTTENKDSVLPENPQPAPEQPAASSPVGENGGDKPAVLEAEKIIEAKFIETGKAIAVSEQTDEARVIQHYESLEGTASDEVRAKIADLLRDYSADWVSEAMTQSHAAAKPKPKVSELLAARKAAEAVPPVAAESPPDQKPDDWYDHEALKAAVQEVFAVRGKQEGYIVAMLRGRAKGKRGKSEWAECNLPPGRLMDAQKLRDWAAWWHNQNKKLTIVKAAAKIQSDILLWWDDGCPTSGQSQAHIPPSERRFESHRMPRPEDYALTEEQQQVLDAMLRAKQAEEQSHEPETA